MGDVDGAADVLVRVHSECLTGDVFHSLRCDCGEQLERALAQIAAEGRGVLLYLAQEGRGIGLLNKLRAYELQEQGLDTVDANLALGLPVDSRDYGIGAQILGRPRADHDPRADQQPAKIVGLEGYGLTVTEQVPIVAEPNPVNARLPAHQARADGPHDHAPGPQAGAAGGRARAVHRVPARVHRPVSEAGAGEIRVPDGCHAITGRPADDVDIAVVASRYNAEVVQRLLRRRGRARWSETASDARPDDGRAGARRLGAAARPAGGWPRPAATTPSSRWAA